MASRVMSMSDSAVQRMVPGGVQASQSPNLSVQMKCSACKEEEIQTKPLLQRAIDGSLLAGSNIESQLNNSKGGGSPLSNEVRSFMEPRFGTDFSGVRAHNKSRQRL